MNINNSPMKVSADFRSASLNQLRGKWCTAILVSVVAMIICGLVSAIPYAGSVISLVIAGPLTLGIISCFIKLVRKESFKFENIFDGFKNFTSAFILQILVTLFVFLWSLLLIVPGIIAAYRYSMAFYLLNDNPNLGAMEALELSKKIMMGNKWRLFCLHLSFIGWAILSILTCGIGFIWLTPYMTTAVTNFYESLEKPVM